VKFGNRLNGRFHKPIYGMDERLSSRAALEKVAVSSRGKKKNTAIDAIAAQIILENWFAELKNI
jgi:putative Holliday junction resolvase